MGYVEKNLMPKEKVLYTAGLHWIIFARPFFLGFLTSFVLTVFSGMPAEAQAGGGSLLPTMAFMGFFFGIIFAVPVSIEKATSEFAVTNRRILMKKGWIKRSTFEMMLQKLEGAQVDQSVLGRILDFGSVKVTGTGGGSDPFKDISDPMTFRKAVYKAIELAESKLSKTT